MVRLRGLACLSFPTSYVLFVGCLRLEAMTVEGSTTEVVLHEYASMKTKLEVSHVASSSSLQLRLSVGLIIVDLPAESGRLAGHCSLYVPELESQLGPQWTEVWI